MPAQVTTLPNGLRIVTEEMHDLPSVTLGVWVGAGARAEKLEQHGVAHFLEHMAFKGTKARSAKQIAEDIENVGGDLNAATSLEQTSYYARVLVDDVPLAVEVLADILMNSLFDDEEIEREKSVILQEIAAIHDSPDDLVFDELQEAAFGAHPLGRAIIGTAQSVSSFKKHDFQSFMSANYLGHQTIISAAGAVKHDEFVARVRDAFGSYKSGKTQTVPATAFQNLWRVHHRPMEQTQIAFAMPGVSYKDKNIYAAHIFAGLLGGGMSSRLFQEVREKRGLCYSVSAFHWAYTDTGLFGLHAATAPEQVKELTNVMMNVVKQAAENCDESELKRARAQFKAGLLMSLEHSAARADRLARQLLVFDKLLPLEEILEKLDRVTLLDVKSFAQEMLQKQQIACAAIGGTRHVQSQDQIHKLLAS